MGMLSRQPQQEILHTAATTDYPPCPPTCGQHTCLETKGVGDAANHEGQGVAGAGAGRGVRGTQQRQQLNVLCRLAEVGGGMGVGGKNSKWQEQQECNQRVGQAGCRECSRAGRAGGSSWQRWAYKARTCSDLPVHGDPCILLALTGSPHAANKNAGTAGNAAMQLHGRPGRLARASVGQRLCRVLQQQASMRVHQRRLAGHQPEGSSIKGGHPARQRGGEAGVDGAAASSGGRLLGVKQHICRGA